jgi:hypothetical protein
VIGAGERTQDQQRGRRLLLDRPNANKARGIVRAAAYIANSNDASVGTDSAGTRYCGRMTAAVEKLLATRTLICRDQRGQPNRLYCCHLLFLSE